MWYIIIAVIVLGVIAAVAGYFRNKKLQKMLERGEIAEIPEAREIPEAGSMKPANVIVCWLPSARKSNITMMRNWIVSADWKEMNMRKKP